jgi:UDP-glucose 4-epimerase
MAARMNVLVTGGAGFIGSNLVERLLDRGDSVVVVDNFATARHDSLPREADGLTMVEASIADSGVLEDAFAFAAPDVVVHAAAAYKDPDDWVEDIRTNSLGTAHVVKTAQEAGVRRLVYLQTALCYGNRPLEQPVTLSHPLRPESSYAISKTAGEEYIRMSGLDFVSLRLANVYGPRNLSGPVPTFFQRLSEGKSCFAVDTRRDFVFVEDLLSVMLPALDGTGSGVYHVSSGRDFSIKELYDAVADVMGVDTPVEERPRGEDDAPSILLDPSRTEADFGWSVETPLADGIRRTIDWYQTHGVAETYTHLRMKD